MAQDFSGRDEGINKTIDDILSAAIGIAEIDDFPPHLAARRLEEAQCAALDLCRAIVDYINTVIQGLNRGSTGWCNLNVF